MTTIKDVALQARVSVGTVSHVITGARRVRPETEARVRAVMDQLDFTPNSLAGSLRSRRTQTVGLVVPDCAHPFFAELATAIEAVGAEAGFGLMLCSTARTAVREVSSLELLLSKRVDAIIVATGSAPSALGRVVSARVPLVLIDTDVPGVLADTVVIDHPHGGRLAAEHLLSLGHRRLGCIAGEPQQSSASRIVGFRSCLAAAGVVISDDVVVMSNAHAEGGYAATQVLLDRDPGITAIFAANDLVALGAIRAAHDRGRPVPSALSVVGFDDVCLANQVLPRLTTVHQPLGEIGRRAISLVLSRLAHPARPTEHHVLPVDLIIRESTSVVTHRAGNKSVEG